jgi:hypothetical protein
VAPQKEKDACVVLFPLLIYTTILALLSSFLVQEPPSILCSVLVLPVPVIVVALPFAVLPEYNCNVLVSKYCPLL